MARKDERPSETSSDRLDRIERVLEQTVELSHRTQKQVEATQKQVEATQGQLDALTSEHRSFVAETRDFMAETRQMNRSLLSLIRQGQARIAKLETRTTRTLKRRASS
ncbi:MAG: hypothetical protein HYV07_03685 [Deltaproteobacteria bacterium]|nr:hypothetical protein [Deltaproteobacteria bacterium]